jgi:hypothetical protein
MLLNSAVSFLGGASRRSSRGSEERRTVSSCGAAKHNQTSVTIPSRGVVLRSILLNVYRSSFYHPIGGLMLCRRIDSVKADSRTFQKKFLPPDTGATYVPGRTGDCTGRTRVRNRRHHISRVTRRIRPRPSHKGHTVAGDNGEVINTAGGGQHGTEGHSALATPCRRGLDDKARGDVATGPCSPATAEPCCFQSPSGQPGGSIPQGQA